MKLGFTVRSHTALGREMLVLASQKVRSPRYDMPSSFHNGFSVGNLTNLAINHVDLTMIISYFMRYMRFLLGIQWDICFSRIQWGYKNRYFMGPGIY